MVADTVWQIRRGTQGTSIPELTEAGARVVDGSASQLVPTTTTPPRIDAVIDPWKNFNFRVAKTTLLPTAGSSDLTRAGALAFIYNPLDTTLSHAEYQVQETSPSVFAWVRLAGYTDTEWHDRDPFLVNATDGVSLEASSTSQAVFLQAELGFAPDAP